MSEDASSRRDALRRGALAAGALAAAGDRNGSRQAYETLLGWWENADPSLAIAAQVRAEYAAIANPTR